MREQGQHWGRARLRLTWLLGAALTAAVLLVACGSDGDSSTKREGAEQPAAQAGQSGEQGAQAKPALTGGERVVFVGDSLAVQAPPNYPDLLPAALEPRAAGVEAVNLAEPGTTAEDWLPGRPLFEERLAPQLDGADLVFVTLGGNDLQDAIGAADGIDALGQAGSGAASPESAFASLHQVSRRLARIYTAIRERAPDAQIVFVGYPDYAEATAWREAGGTLGIIALGVGLSALVDAAMDSGPDLLIDMTEPTAAAGVDSLLADTEHLSAAGHEFYARRIARILTR